MMNEELSSYKKYIDFKNKNIIDIGANEGVMSDFFNKESDSTAKILCIEPHKDNISILQNRFNNNKQITICHGAITTYNGVCNIGLEQQERKNGLKQGHVLDINSIDLQNRDWDKKNNDIPCWNLETKCRNMDIIKMDIEGYEHSILYNSLQNMNKKIWLLEIHSWEDIELHGWNQSTHIKEKDSLNKMLKYFSKNGYNNFLLAKSTGNIKDMDTNVYWSDVTLSQYRQEGKIVYYKVVNIIIM